MLDTHFLLLKYEILTLDRDHSFCEIRFVILMLKLITRSVR
jgi:hypothetical protein